VHLHISIGSMIYPTEQCRAHCSVMCSTRTRVLIHNSLINLTHTKPQFLFGVNIYTAPVYQQLMSKAQMSHSSNKAGIIASIYHNNTSCYSKTRLQEFSSLNRFPSASISTSSSSSRHTDKTRNNMRQWRQQTDL